jgi:histidyl-tRNA synthetase
MILDGIFEHCGVGVDLIRPISSCIDKLDKLEWDQVKQEMIQKGCSESVCDLIHTWVTKSGSLELIQELLKSELYTNSKARQGIFILTIGLTEMKLLYEYLESFGITKYVVFDLSLARGLDYYTGVIYEAVLQRKFLIN